jgi:hypothetical protein
MKTPFDYFLYHFFTRLAPGTGKPSMRISRIYSSSSSSSGNYLGNTLTILSAHQIEPCTNFLIHDCLELLLL